MMLDLDVPVDAVSAVEGETALMAAVFQGKRFVARLLIRAGANVNAADNREGSQHRGKTPIICASEHGHTECVRLLIKAGADVQAVDCEGDTSLMAASQNGHIECAKLLIKAGADVDCVDHNGWTALIQGACSLLIVLKWEGGGF